MGDRESFGFDPEDVDRFVREAGDQLRGVMGQLGGLFEGSADRTGFSGLFGEFGQRARPKPEPETTGDTGDGVWVIYAVDERGGAQVDQVFATELDALRANQHNTDGRRRVRFLPYGMAASVLDEPHDSAGEDASRS